RGEAAAATRHVRGPPPGAPSLGPHQARFRLGASCIQEPGMKPRGRYITVNAAARKLGWTYFEALTRLRVRREGGHFLVLIADVRRALAERAGQRRAP